jgi:hypothetical protein
VEDLEAVEELLTLDLLLEDLEFLEKEAMVDKVEDLHHHKVFMVVAVVVKEELVRLELHLHKVVVEQGQQVL